MVQPTQVIPNTPDKNWVAIDNATSPTYPTLSASTSLGYDTKTGAIAQGLNSFADTGTVLLDSVNDTVWADPQVATVKGNPISNTQPVYATVSTVLNNATTGVRVLWKNPA